jgi:general L-amino acid transport system permease protein
MTVEPEAHLAPPPSSLWNNPRFRALLFQVIIVSVVVTFFTYIIHNTLHNLEQRGITTGFSFLSSEAGFGILQTLIEYNEISSYGHVFLVGLLNTILVSALGIAIATILGFIIGIARLSNNWLVAKLAAVYIEIFRNIPLLLQIFFWYFAVLRTLPSPRQSWEWGELIFLNIRGLYLPKPLLQPGFDWVWLALGVAILLVVFLNNRAKRRQDRTGERFPVLATALAILMGLPLVAFVVAGTPLTWELPTLKGFNFRGGLTVLPELSALLMALSIYTAAFIAEIVRAGVQAVPFGQTEAASALGLSRGQTLRWVILPQAMRVVIPPLTSQYLNLTKNSSLATAIGYPDLVSVFAGTTLNQTGQAIEVITMTMAVYLCLSLLISLVMNWYNWRMVNSES